MPGWRSGASQRTGAASPYSMHDQETPRPSEVRGTTRGGRLQNSGGAASSQAAAPPTARHLLGEVREENRKFCVDALNDQLKRCTEEINRRSGTQHTLQAGSVSVNTAIVGLVISGRVTVMLLLLLPLVTSAFFGQWLDHDRLIQSIGRYMSQQVEPALREALQFLRETDFEFWESYIRRTPATNVRPRGRMLAWSIAYLFVFPGVAALALVFTFPAAVLSPEKYIPIGLPSSGIALWPRIVWVLDLAVIAATLLAAAVSLRHRD